jgi:hypothetical protein
VLLLPRFVCLRKLLRRAIKNVFRQLVWECIADHILSEEEEAILSNVQQALAIPSNAWTAERNALDQLRRTASFAEVLPTISVPVPLQPREVCHHLTLGTLLEKRITRAETRNGKRVTQEELVATKEGTLYVTSKRLLIVGEGTSSIPHAKILDVEIDPDEQLITIVKDGRQKPLFLRTGDPLYTGILIEHLSSGMQS